MKRKTSQDTPDQVGFFSSLVYPDYCLLWGATACGQAAAWALVVLRAALVYELTKSNAWVGFITMAAQLPSLIITPFAGFLADRFDRRRVLACTFTLNLLNNLFLAVLVVSDQITPLSLLGIALINGVLRATEMPATQALLPNLVPDRYLLNAVALNQLMQQGSRMIGPLLLLPVLHFIGPKPAFFLCSVFYAVGWSLVIFIRTSSRGEVSNQGVLTNLVAGIRYSYAQPLLLSFMLMAVFHCALTMAYEAAFPFVARTQLGLVSDKDLFAGPTYLMIGVGAGAVLGNLALAKVGSAQVRGQLFLWLGLASGITPIVLSLMTTIPAAMIAVAAVGASTAAFMTLSNGAVQMLAPDGLRGRVVSAQTWHTQGTMAGFNAVNGMLMDVPWMTAPLLLGGTGLLFVLIVLGSVFTVHLRTVYTRGVPTVALAR
ncbi:MAG: MFS transporter [Candidatus Tectomicrobia bacterium]|uniref:MFS transporter n=1 Tax=Tectimicrobiota bacterium TaxID=2528274 RepID=A0A938B1W9_UNCTE|nr:MFS transporter [Candidatus Tectomicrobia bacterium]